MAIRTPCLRSRLSWIQPRWSRPVSIRLLPVLSRLLGRIQGEVGVAQGLGRAHRALIGLDGQQPDADGQKHLLSLDDKWSSDRIDDPFGLSECLPLVGHGLDQDGELVAAQAGHHPVFGGGGDQPAGDVDKDVVAGGVAEGVVDVFKPVQVDEHHRLAVTPTRPSAHSSRSASTIRLGSPVSGSWMAR